MQKSGSSDFCDGRLDAFQHSSLGPLVSIGIPVYNESGQIEKCIRNIFEQSYPNIEICLSDNCSTDDTYEKAIALLKDRPNTKIVRQKENVGLAANFDTVRRMATGKYFMWVAADDSRYPTHVEKLVDELEAHPRASVAQSAAHRIDADGNIQDEIRYTGAINPNTTGILAQAMNVLSVDGAIVVRKMSQFIYGLFRKSVIDRMMNFSHNALSGGDRMVVALAALAGGLRYVDEILFVKYLHARPYNQRNPDDVFNKIKRRRKKAIISEIIWWTFFNPAVPYRRRLYGPVIAFPFLLSMLERGKRVPRPIRYGAKAVMAGVRRMSAHK